MSFLPKAVSTSLNLRRSAEPDSCFGHTKYAMTSDTYIIKNSDHSENFESLFRVLDVGLFFLCIICP